MKRIMRFWTLLALLAMTACEHKELCYEHPHVGFVRVLFDWSQLPGANPECMYVRFFPEGGRPPGAVRIYGTRRRYGAVVSGQLPDYLP